VAILNNSTSQKPIDLRNCDLESSAVGAEAVIASPGSPEEIHSAFENHKGAAAPGVKKCRADGPVWSTDASC
jgi:hypothetical protein